MTLAERLLPELEQQLANTLKVLNEVPDGRNDFAPHERSMPLTRLAGHTAELAGFAHLHLTVPSINMGTPEDQRKILRMTTVPTLLADFDELADKAITALKSTTDEAFDQPFTLSVKGSQRWAGTRYEAYRSVAFDHMLHHRGQLTVYLRLLGAPVPATFGPSADESV